MGAQNANKPQNCKQTTFMVICDLESDLHSVGDENILLFSDSKYYRFGISISYKSYVHFEGRIKLRLT